MASAEIQDGVVEGRGINRRPPSSVDASLLATSLFHGDDKSPALFNINILGNNKRQKYNREHAGIRSASEIEYRSGA